MVGLLGFGMSNSEPLNITTFDNSKSKRVHYLSPLCIAKNSTLQPLCGLGIETLQLGIVLHPTLDLQPFCYRPNVTYIE